MDVRKEISWTQQFPCRHKHASLHKHISSPGMHCSRFFTKRVLGKYQAKDCIVFAKLHLILNTQHYRGAASAILMTGLAEKHSSEISLEFCVHLETV